MVGDLLTELKKYKKDKKENEQEIQILGTEKFDKAYWQDLHVGDIINININTVVPADCLIIDTDN